MQNTKYSYFLVVWMETLLSLKGRCSLPATGLAYTLHSVHYTQLSLQVKVSLYLKIAILQITSPEKPIKLLTKCHYFHNGKINQLSSSVLNPFTKTSCWIWLEWTKRTTWLQTRSTLKALAYSLMSWWKPIGSICTAALTQHSLRNLLPKHIILYFNKI